MERNIRLLRICIALSIFGLAVEIHGSAVVVAGPALPDLQSAGALGDELFLKSGSIGMVMVVVRGNQVFFHGYGETSPGSGRVPDAESVVRLCSLTKIFTTDLLGKMVAGKTVRLNDRLMRYAPAHVVVPEKARLITLEELATHTSGLPREVGSGPRGTPHFTYPDYRTRWRWLAGQRLRMTPGTAASYSNVAFDLLSDALQTAGQEPYARLLVEQTLNPLKMRETTFYPNASQCARLLVPTGDEGPCTPTEQTEGSSGLYSTANDVSVWLKYLMGSGVLAQEKSAQAVYLLPGSLKSVQGLDHAGTPTGIGLGWMHLLAVGDASHLIEKTGGGAGFSTYIAVNQARKTAIFFAATDGPGGRQFNLFKGANDVLLRMAGLPPMPPDGPRPVKKRMRRRRGR